MLFSFILVSVIPQTRTFASDPENKFEKKSIDLPHLLDMSGSIQVLGGYISNNGYGEDGFCSSFLFQPRLTLSGVPINVTWNIVKAPYGPLQFGRFNLSFSKGEFLHYLESAQLDSLTHLSNDSLEEYNDVKSQLSDREYLKKVSDSNIQYTQLRNDSVTGKLDANDAMRMDSLREVVSKYEILNRRFHELKFVGSSLKEINNQTISESSAKKIDNIKGEGKAISDSLKAIPDLSNLNKAQKIFMRFDDIILGYGVLNHSQLSVMGYPFTGAGLNYNYKGVIAGVTAGKHSSFFNSTSFNFSSISSYPSRFAEQSGILHVKAGLGDKENHSILSLTSFYPTNVQLQGATDQNYKGNVFSLISSKELGENSKVEFEIAKSSQGLDESSNTSRKLHQVAISASATNELPRLNASIQIHYLNMGRDFHTLGNPYLSSGFQLLGLAVGKSILNGKINSDISLNNSWSSAEDEKDGGWRRYSGSVGINYHILKNANVSWKYFSNTFYQDHSIQAGKQKTLSNQVSVNLSVSKRSSVNVTGQSGRSAQGDELLSRNYLAFTSYTLRYKKNSIMVQLNYYKTITKTTQMENSSVTIGNRISFGKKLTTYLSVGAYLNKNSTSSQLNYGIGYSLGKMISIDLSGGLNSYFYQDGSTPGYTGFQTMCTISMNF